MVKNQPANAGDVETRVQSLGQEDPLEEETATHSSILAWRIPWTEDPGGLQCKGLQVGHNLASEHACRGRVTITLFCHSSENAATNNTEKWFCSLKLY